MQTETVRLYRSAFVSVRALKLTLMWRDRSGEEGQVNFEGRVKFQGRRVLAFDYYIVTACCVIVPAKLTRFPRVTADAIRSSAISFLINAERQPRLSGIKHD